MIRKKTKKNLLFIILIILLFVFVGIAYSWYYTSVNGNALAKNTFLGTGKLEITFANESELNVSGVIPGDTLIKTFTITNTGDSIASYKIAWENFTNTFTNKADLVYNVVSTNGGGSLNSTQLPNTGEHILIMNNIVISPGVTQSYTMSIQFLRKQTDQSLEKNKILTGKLEVCDVHDSTTIPTKTYSPILNDTLYGLTKESYLNEVRLNITNTLYPIGSIYRSLSPNNPSEKFGGTWQAYAKGKLLVGIDETDVDFDELTDNVGEKEIVLTVAQLPRHTHTYSYANRIVKKESGADTTHYTVFSYETQSTGDTGESAPHNNLQPYQTVYMWKRIA